MNSLTTVVQQLRKERERAQREVHRIDAALTALGNLSVNGSKHGRRTLSAAARRKISLAQKKRWSKLKASGPSGKPKRTISAASRRRMAAGQRARWAKVKTKA